MLVQLQLPDLQQSEIADLDPFAMNLLDTFHKTILFYVVHLHNFQDACPFNPPICVNKLSMCSNLFAKSITVKKESHAKSASVTS